MPDSDYLKPTTEGIFEDCPRFRVLVVGRSGVGKSSLINAAFKVDLANVSKLRPGFSNIEQEITTPENPLFVLHDSQGYEPGETQNLGTLKAFIESRSNMPRLADRLHAIWLCIEIPIAGGRVTETGDEALLKLRSELPPSLPFIVVFTKYDQFVSAKEYELLNSLNNLDDMTDDEVEQTVQSRLGQDFADLCLDKLRKVSPELPLWVYVSADARYTETLKGLLGLTHKHIVDSVSIILASAQRVDATAKIDASIAVGRKKYWRGLASSMHFPGKTLRACLRALHTDIVTIWNFRDPLNRLHSEDFMAVITEITADMYHFEEAERVESAGHGDRSPSMESFNSTLSVVAMLAPGAIPVLIPMAAAVAFAAWAYQMYEQTPKVVCCLLAYIVDLTNIMQSLFWLERARGKDKPVSFDLINLAIEAYCCSPVRNQIHGEIRNFIHTSNVLRLIHRDRTLDEVVRLIETYRFEPAAEYVQRATTLPLGW